MKTVERYVDDSGREHETRQAAAAGDIALHLGVGISVAHDIVAKRHFLEAVFATLDTPLRWRGQARGREAIRAAMLGGLVSEDASILPGVDFTIAGGAIAAGLLINNGALPNGPEGPADA